MGERDFCIYNAVNTRQTAKVLSWLDWADAVKIKAKAESPMIILELQHCLKEYVEEFADALGNKIRAKSIAYNGIQTAADKEKWIALLYVKAYSTFNRFKGALDILGVRQQIVKQRLNLSDAELVITAEEKYSFESAQLIAGQALAWDEHMSVSYMESNLVEEMLVFLISDTPEKRAGRYTRVLDRSLTENEAGIINQYALKRANGFIDWMEEYVSYHLYMHSAPSDVMSEYFLQYGRDILISGCLGAKDSARIRRLLKAVLLIPNVNE